MNTHYNYLSIITLSFSALFWVSTNTGHINVKMTINSNNETSKKNFTNNRFEHYFSNHNTWNNNNFHRPSPYRHQFNTRTTTCDFQQYFTMHRYTENQILNQRCLYMFDNFVKLAQTYSNYEYTIKQLHAKLKNLNILQKAYYTAKGSYCAGLQKRIHFLYLQLCAIKNQPYENDLPSNNNSYCSSDESGTYATPTWKDHSLEIFPAQQCEYDELQSTYNTHMPFLSNAIEKRINAYKNMTIHGQSKEHSNKSYNFNNNIKNLLYLSEHNTTRFTQCYGNQLHHTIHQESLDIINHVNNLPHNSILYDHQQALIDFTVAMIDYNHENLTDKAMCIGDLCWTLLDYGQAIAEGAALGIYSAATDILNNPIQATINIVAGKQVLTYQLSKVLYNIADIGITAITNFDQAKDKWNKYTEPLNHIISAIYNKEITIRDTIKNSTAFVVGYKAQSKLLSGLDKFCNTIKQKNLNFIKNNSLLNPQEHLTTPEGLLFKATAQSSKLKQSVKSNSASNIKNNIDRKVAKNNSIKGLIKEAKLPTKGKMRYIPPKKFHISEGLPMAPMPDNSKAFVDRFGNIWIRGRSVTKGQAFEWDVQLSKQGIVQVGWMTKDNSHLNVSLDGRVTHK